jgi:peptide-methionine (R)-S-oxide reductase
VNKDALSSEAYHVLCERGTERPFSSSFHAKSPSDGMYRCVGCGSELFHSADQFDAGCGWPSFSRPASVERITVHRDISHGMERTEVRCTSCNGHLGHVFQDGPSATGERHCINGVCLVFEPVDETETDRP